MLFKASLAIRSEVISYVLLCTSRKDQLIRDKIIDCKACSVM